MIREGHPRSFGFQRITSTPLRVDWVTAPGGVATMNRSTRHEWESPAGSRLLLNADAPVLRRVPIDETTQPERARCLVFPAYATIEGRYLYESVDPPGCPLPPLHARAR